MRYKNLETIERLVEIRNKNDYRSQGWMDIFCVLGVYIISELWFPGLLPWAFVLLALLIISALMSDGARIYNKLNEKILEELTEEAQE